jgi:N-carbamoyl-L-amino-acid hydrolase
MRVESVSGAVSFDPGLAQRIATEDDGDDSTAPRQAQDIGRSGRRWPIIATMAGHDAGIVSEAGTPTAMLFVRNPTGVSHSPAELVETADCLVGVEALADTLQRLAS